MVSSDVDTFLGFAIVAKPSNEGFVHKYFGVFSTFSPNIIPQEDNKINEINGVLHGCCLQECFKETM